MGSSYLNYRDSLKKKWFKPYGEVTNEAQANVPPGLEKDDWNRLMDLWSKQDYIWYYYKEFIIKFIFNYCLVDLVYGSFLNVGHVFEKQGKSG